MLFPSVTFAGFFVVVYFVHLLLAGRTRLWKLAMLAASFTFYGWWDWRFCALIAASIMANWALGAAVAATTGRRSRPWVALAVLANLAVLGGFKYYGFFIEAVSASLGSTLGLPVLDLALPVGISFFTFQALSYVVDLHRRTLEPRPLLDFAVYLSFFPQLVAGPIVRASEFLPQLDRPRDAVDVNEAAWLIGRGLFKKMVVASYLAQEVVDPVFASPATADRIELLLAFYGYAIQIYADFSGYTDIAIGIALLLGFRFPSNFDQPYRARSIQDFWHRWHQTLSRWLRDYLYVPLGGNRISELATYRNLLATMVLGGLWHGAAWTFVIWGAIHGLALCAGRLAERAPERWRIRPGPVLGWLVTFHVVCVAWVLFRAPTFETAWSVLVGLVTAPIGSSVNVAAALLIAAALALQLAPTTPAARLRALIGRVDPAVHSAAVGVWIALVAGLGPDGVDPFIYFQF
ncbi:MAG: MBOAT family protein [Acidimicrobiia bacterium]|nr:MBOAT family protein [Acidimicrobiia bacterium]